MPFLDPARYREATNGWRWYRRRTEAGWSVFAAACNGASHLEGDWVAHIAKALGLEATLRPVGRPRKPAATEEAGPGLLFDEGNID